jgi:hypothetical protein
LRDYAGVDVMLLDMHAIPSELFLDIFYCFNNFFYVFIREKISNFETKKLAQKNSKNFKKNSQKFLKIFSRRNFSN